MGWWITLGVLTLLAVLPLGVSARYDAAGFLLKVILGPLKITLFPRPKREKKTAKKKVPDTKQEPQKKEEPAETKPKPDKPAPKPPQNPPPPPTPGEKGGKLTDFLPLVKVALDLLNSLRRKLRVDVLELKLILAGDDPCKLAVNYGRTWAAVGNLMPQLERFLVIKKRNVEVECDFATSETKVTARLDLTITLGRLLALAVVFGFRALKEYLKINKQRKGGAVI